jgi:hypothetical protein
MRPEISGYECANVGGKNYEFTFVRAKSRTPLKRIFFFKEISVRWEIGGTNYEFTNMRPEISGYENTNVRMGGVS